MALPFLTTAKRFWNRSRRSKPYSKENIVADAAPEPGTRRHTKAEYELIAGRLDRQLELLNKKVRALITPELPEALTHGDLEADWPAPPFYARRRIA